MAKNILFDVFKPFFNFGLVSKIIFIITKTVNNMNFAFSEDLMMLKEHARELTKSVIKPLAQKIDEKEFIPPELIKK